jgi:hypothetical protein
MLRNGNCRARRIFSLAVCLSGAEPACLTARQTEKLLKEGFILNCSTGLCQTFYLEQTDEYAAAEAEAKLKD